MNTKKILWSFTHHNLSVSSNLSRKTKIKKLFLPPFLASVLMDTGVSSIGPSSLRQFILTDSINGWAVICLGNKNQKLLSFGTLSLVGASRTVYSHSLGGRHLSGKQKSKSCFFRLPSGRYGSCVHWLEHLRQFSATNHSQCWESV